MTTLSEAPKGLHALVLGASGITGWGIVNAALSYPANDTFERVIGLTSRPLSIENAFLPKDSRLHLHSGLDLSKDAPDIINFLKEIDGIEETTHIYFACEIIPSFVEWEIGSSQFGPLAYVHHGWGEEDAEKRIGENVRFIVNAVIALEKACPKMQFLTYPTGGKVSIPKGL